MILPHEGWAYLSLLGTNQTICFSFFYFQLQEENSFFTRFEELLRLTDLAKPVITYDECVDSF